MKGLLRKDCHMIWNYGRMLLLISLVFLIAGALSKEENFFFVVYPVLLGGVLPVTLLSYEERCGWNRFCDAMPLSRRTVVSARYVTTLLSFGALYLLTLLVNALFGRPAAELGELALLLPGFGLLPSAIMLPISLRWGVEKGRIAYFILIGVFVALGMFLFDSIRVIGTTVPAPGVAASLIAAIVIFALSWLLSIRLYEKREL